MTQSLERHFLQTLSCGHVIRSINVVGIEPSIVWPAIGDETDGLPIPVRCYECEPPAMCTVVEQIEVPPNTEEVADG